MVPYVEDLHGAYLGLAQLRTWQGAVGNACSRQEAMGHMRMGHNEGT